MGRPTACPGRRAAARSASTSTSRPSWSALRRPPRPRAARTARSSASGRRARQAGSADVQCTLGGTPLYDGSDTHSEVPQFVFPRPGSWSCSARGWTEGVDNANERVLSGRRSAPIDVRRAQRLPLARGQDRRRAHQAPAAALPRGVRRRGARRRRAREAPARHRLQGPPLRHPQGRHVPRALRAQARRGEGPPPQARLLLRALRLRRHALPAPALADGSVAIEGPARSA